MLHPVLVGCSVRSRYGRRCGKGRMLGGAGPAVPAVHLPSV